MFTPNILTYANMKNKNISRRMLIYELICGIVFLYKSIQYYKLLACKVIF